MQELDEEIAKAERNFIGWKRQLERLKLQREQQQAAARAGKPRGRNGGRKPALSAEQIEQAQILLLSLPLEIVADRLNVSTRTLERYKIRPAQVVCNL